MSSRPESKPAETGRAPAEGERAPRERLSPEARRRQLLTVASGIVTEQGVEHLEIRALAARAGVTRPVVYRYFPTRKALVLALLEDFADATEEAYRQALVASYGQPLDEITKNFIAASCEVIERKGAGPWHLLGTRGADREVAEVGEAMHERMLQPWLGRIAEITGLSRADVRVIAPVVVAAGRAALDPWIDGRLPKRRAVDHAARAVTALLAEYARFPAH